MAECSTGSEVRDRTEEIRGAVVHHGPVSDRAYLLRSSGEACVDVEVLEGLGAEMGYGKLFAKVSSGDREAFERAGFVTEARVPLAYSGEEILFCSRFLDPDREVESTEDEVELVLGESASASSGTEGTPLADPAEGELEGYELRVADMPDAPEVARLYAEVFESYPFPITSPGFIAGEMKSGTVFVVAVAETRIVAAASAEVDSTTASCEMTDFATVSEHRGAGLASALLERLESAARDRGVMTAYTIARATSAGMNIVFARRGYRYGGLLVNNTGICGDIESMNVWYRSITEEPGAAVERRE